MTVVTFRGRPASRVRLPSLSTLVVGVLTAAALALVSTLLAEPPFVPRISFVNPTPFDIRIDVAGAGRSGWMGVGYAGKNRTSIAQEVFDVGEVWVFRLRGQGEDGGELHFLRSQLEQSQWKVQLPASVGARLTAEGVPPTP
jgi:hypothetical protein